MTPPVYQQVERIKRDTLSPLCHRRVALRPATAGGQLAAIHQKSEVTTAAPDAVEDEIFPCAESAPPVILSANLE